MRVALGLAVLALAAAPPAAPAASRPSVVMILLDTTRADRFGSQGSGIDTTPVLDGLAARGVEFRRHFANSHATRPSMPQLLSGRYYHPSILRPFEPDSNPRDYPFLQTDPSARLLTDLVAQAGYALLGVSAHPWVDADCRMGRSFERLEYVEAPAKRGHAAADAVVDRAVALWDARPTDRPTFLYVHLLDVHVPRHLPGAALRFLDPPVPWEGRFGRNGEPRFGKARRHWDLFDGRDFGADDRRIYRAFYDTLLAYMDGEVGRLLEHVKQNDPTLAETLIVIAADHGEQLGEEGRIRHGETLADPVQHVPLILAGAGIAPGQRVERFTENIDVAPTVAALLDLPVPEGTFDGRALLGRDGHVCEDCPSRPAVYYAWSDYQAVRTKRWLLRVDPPGTPSTFCPGEGIFLWKLDGHGGRAPVHDDQRVRLLRRKLARRLDRRAARLEDGLREQPLEPFFVPVDYWHLGPQTQLACVPIDGGIDPAALQRPGWLLVREGLLLLHGAGAPLDATVTVPNGAYDVAAGVRPLGWLWQIPGFFGRAEDALREKEPAAYVPLGRVVAHDRALRVRVPPSAGRGQRIVSLRLSPVGAHAKQAPTVDVEQRERLRTLGYVE